ncbi:MAG: DMT family transporter, partial [Prevotellaceae bacterium]|nr:DMT family transporter [Prevotellaceae bacterium]
SDKVGDIRGDLLCMMAQLSFALFLALFSNLVRRYSVITVNKWMFTWGTLLIIPAASPHLATLPWAQLTLRTWADSFFVVFFGTFMSYLLMMNAQKVLRPTVVSVYNYVQPIVAVTVSVLTGMAVFTVSQGVAIILVFSGVWLVIKSKSRRDAEKEAAPKA